MDAVCASHARCKMKRLKNEAIVSLIERLTGEVIPQQLSKEKEVEILTRRQTMTRQSVQKDGAIQSSPMKFRGSTMNCDKGAAGLARS